MKKHRIYHCTLRKSATATLGSETVSSVSETVYIKMSAYIVIPEGAGLGAVTNEFARQYGEDDAKLLDSYNFIGETFI